MGIVHALLSVDNSIFEEFRKSDSYFKKLYPATE